VDIQPVEQRDRYASLDILRGLALYGVLIVNLLTLFRVSLFARMIGEDRPSDAPGRFLLSAMGTLMEFKAFTLFSFLFGVGIALQARRMEARGSVPRFLLRRFLVLLAFGLIHLYLIWNGDILTLYAVCGFLLIPLLRLPPIWMAFGGALLIGWSAFGSFPIDFPDTPALRAHAAEATRAYASGGFAQVLAFRIYETNRLIVPLLALTLPRTVGAMMLGVAAWRSGSLTAGRRWWPAILTVSIMMAIAGIYWRVDEAEHFGLAFAYATVVLLWIRRAPLIAAAGRMALTNYLTQSIVFSIVFYGYGFGMFGRVGVTPVIVWGTAFYIAQLAFSRWWLGRFRFGPFEWVWRSLTYGRRQPILYRREARVATL
jgi:uncharacterized protein